MRVAPWEEPRSWPRRKRSRPMTFRPRSASERAAADPWAPSPTTTTSVRSTGGPGGTARLPFDRARAGRAMSATPSSSASRSPSDVYTCGAARTTAARSRPARSHRPWPAGTETSCTARSARASATSRGSAPSTRNVTSAPRAAGGSARVTPGISARPARSRRAPRDEVLGDRLDAERLGLGERDAEPEAQCVRRLPGLEAAGGRVQAPRAVGGPGRAAHVGGERLEALEQLAAHVEQRGAARAAQVLAAGRDQQVAADLAHVDGQVPDGLGRVEQVGDAGLAGETPSLRDRLDEPGRRRDVRHRQQGRRAGGQRRAQRLEVQRAVVAVGQQLDDDAPVALEGEQLQRAAHVARPRDEHAVAAAEAQRVDGALPADRRALGERDLVRVGAEEPGGERVDGVEARPGGVGRLVAAHARLEVQVLERRRERAGAGQRGAGGVEVVGVADPGSARPLDLDVDQHRCVGEGRRARGCGRRSRRAPGAGARGRRA